MNTTARTAHDHPAPRAGRGVLRRTLGSNQVAMRRFNERVVLQAIRLHGALPKAEAARLRRLGTQTARSSSTACSTTASW